MKRVAAILAVLVAALPFCGVDAAGDMPLPETLQWSGIGNQGRNSVSPATGLPETIGEDNVLWELPLRAKSLYMQPVVFEGRLYVGTTFEALEDEALKAALESKCPVLLCLDAATGERIWEGALPAYGGAYGVVTPPAWEDGRLWVKFGNVIACLDADGLADGNDGMTHETDVMVKRHWRGDIIGKKMETLGAGLADLLWTADIKQLVGTQPHDSSCGTPLVIGKQLWVPTSNCWGVAYPPAHYDSAKLEALLAEGKLKPSRGGPNLLVLDKDTGELIAKDPLAIPRVFHGQWSSPSTGVVGGRRLVFWGDGYGFLHAFALPDTDGAEEVVDLQVAWSLDCNPRRYRYDDEGNERPYPLHDTKKRWETPGVGIGPGEVIATPVFHEGRVYVALGRDRAYSREHEEIYNGTLLCIDPAEVDDAGRPRVVWRSEELHRTQSTVSIADGLLYVADMGGLMNCFDVRSGEKLWQQDLGARVECRSQLVADGKVYIGTDRSEFYVLRAGREPAVLFQTKLRDHVATPGAVDGVLFVAGPRGVTAYRGPGHAAP